MFQKVFFLDDGLILKKLFFEAIPSSYFVQKTAKIRVCVKDKKATWEPLVVKAWNNLGFGSKIVSH